MPAASACTPPNPCLPLPSLPALQRWAGPDQAKALSLCNWLYHRVASLAAFLPAAEAQQPTEQQPEGGEAGQHWCLMV